MRYLLYLTFVFVISVKLHALNVLVNTTGFAPPYYTFSINDGTDFDITSSGSESLIAGVEYTFTGNNSSHPFSMYITDSLGNQTNLVNNLSLRGSQTFTLDPNLDYSTYTATYVCDLHPVMVGSFNISPIPEPAAYSLLIGLLVLGLLALRRR